jgi:hypothetical protein
MKAYKFVGKDLKNQGFQWQIGKWFKQDEKLELCKNGFHASKEPIDVLEYTSNGERLFVVETRGKILKDTDKFCSSPHMALRFDSKVDKSVESSRLWSSDSFTIFLHNLLLTPMRATHTR